MGMFETVFTLLQPSIIHSCPHGILQIRLGLSLVSGLSLSPAHGVPPEVFCPEVIGPHICKLVLTQVGVATKLLCSFNLSQLYLTGTHNLLVLTHGSAQCSKFSGKNLMS